MNLYLLLLIVTLLPGSVVPSCPSSTDAEKALNTRQKAILKQSLRTVPYPSNYKIGTVKFSRKVSPRADGAYFEAIIVGDCAADEFTLHRIAFPDNKLSTMNQDFECISATNISSLNKSSIFSYPSIDVPKPAGNAAKLCQTTANSANIISTFAMSTVNSTSGTRAPAFSLIQVQEGTSTYLFNIKQSTADTSNSDVFEVFEFKTYNGFDGNLLLSAIPVADATEKMYDNDTNTQYLLLTRTNTATPAIKLSLFDKYGADRTFSSPIRSFVATGNGK